MQATMTHKRWSVGWKILEISPDLPVPLLAFTASASISPFFALSSQLPAVSLRYFFPSTGLVVRHSFALSHYFTSFPFSISMFFYPCSDAASTQIIDF